MIYPGIIASKWCSLAPESMGFTYSLLKSPGIPSLTITK